MRLLRSQAAPSGHSATANSALDASAIASMSGMLPIGKSRPATASAGPDILGVTPARHMAMPSAMKLSGKIAPGTSSPIAPAVPPR